MLQSIGLGNVARRHNTDKKGANKYEGGYSEGKGRRVSKRLATLCLRKDKQLMMTPPPENVLSPLQETASLSNGHNRMAISMTKINRNPQVLAYSYLLNE